MLKARQGMHARTPNRILQEIAEEIHNLSKGTSFQQRLSEVQLLHQVPLPMLGSYFAVLTRTVTGGSATNFRNIAVEFWRSKNVIQSTG